MSAIRERFREKQRRQREALQEARKRRSKQRQQQAHQRHQTPANAVRAEHDAAHKAQLLAKRQEVARREQEDRLTKTSERRRRESEHAEEVEGDDDDDDDDLQGLPDSPVNSHRQNSALATKRQTLAKYAYRKQQLRAHLNKAAAVRRSSRDRDSGTTVLVGDASHASVHKADFAGNDCQYGNQLDGQPSLPPPAASSGKADER